MNAEKVGTALAYTVAGIGIVVVALLALVVLAVAAASALAVGLLWAIGAMGKALFLIPASNVLIDGAGRRRR